MRCCGGFDFRNQRLGNQWKSESLPELHRGFVEFLLEGGAKLRAVLGDDAVDERDCLGASANAPLRPSGAARPARLELVRGVRVHCVFKPLKNGD